LIVIVCVFNQAHSTPKWGWADRGKDREPKTYAFTWESKEDIF